jgi:hypothetical protein
MPREKQGHTADCVYVATEASLLLPSVIIHEPHFSTFWRCSSSFASGLLLGSRGGDA